MSITVINSDLVTYPLTADDIRDGHAYQSDHETIYIGNSFGEICAYSICGNAVVFKTEDNTRFREINIEIRVV